MAHVNDAAFTALRQLGYTGALPDMRYAYQRDIGVRLSSLYLQATGLPHVSDAALEFWSNPEYYPQPIIDGLYADGEAGTFSDIRTYATNYFSDAGTTPATIGDPIYQINDQSGNGADWTEATATARPMLQSDSSGEYLRFDLGDDVLTTTLVAGTYTVVLPTREGIFFDEVTHAGGTFSIGPTSYTGGPAGILTALATGGECRMIGPPMAVNRSLTAAEKAADVQWFQNRGAGPELELGPEVFSDPDFSNPSAWNLLTGSISGGQLTLNGGETARETDVTDLSATYIAAVEIASKSGGTLFVSSSSGSGYITGAFTVSSNTAGFYRGITIPAAASDDALIILIGSGQVCVVDSVSLRKLQPKGA